MVRCHLGVVAAAAAGGGLASLEAKIVEGRDTAQEEGGTYEAVFAGEGETLTVTMKEKAS